LGYAEPSLRVPTLKLRGAFKRQRRWTSDCSGFSARRRVSLRRKTQLGDPVKYSFCLGGKDGVPFPVDCKSYDEIIDFFQNAADKAKIGDKERTNTLKRLRHLVPSG